MGGLLDHDDDNECENINNTKIGGDENINNTKILFPSSIMSGLDSLSLSPGMYVRVHGLKGAKHLNGRIGMIEAVAETDILDSSSCEMDPEGSTDSGALTFGNASAAGIIEGRNGSRNGNGSDATNDTKGSDSGNERYAIRLLRFTETGTKSLRLENFKNSLAVNLKSETPGSQTGSQTGKRCKRPAAKPETPNQNRRWLNNEVLIPGARVKLEGLKNAPKLNGREGIVVSYVEGHSKLSTTDPSTGCSARVGVQLVEVESVDETVEKGWHQDIAGKEIKKENTDAKATNNAKENTDTKPAPKSRFIQPEPWDDNFDDPRRTLVWDAEAKSIKRNNLEVLGIQTTIEIVKLRESQESDVGLGEKKGEKKTSWLKAKKTVSLEEFLWMRKEERREKILAKKKREAEEREKDEFSIVNVERRKNEIRLAEKQNYRKLLDAAIEEEDFLECHRLKTERDGAIEIALARYDSEVSAGKAAARAAKLAASLKELEDAPETKNKEAGEKQKQPTEAEPKEKTYYTITRNYNSVFKPALLRLAIETVCSGRDSPLIWTARDEKSDVTNLEQSISPESWFRYVLGGIFDYPNSWRITGCGSANCSRTKEREIAGEPLTEAGISGKKLASDQENRNSKTRKPSAPSTSSLSSTTAPSCCGDPTCPAKATAQGSPRANIAKNTLTINDHALHLRALQTTFRKKFSFTSAKASMIGSIDIIAKRFFVSEFSNRDDILKEASKRQAKRVAEARKEQVKKRNLKAQNLNQKSQNQKPASSSSATGATASTNTAATSSTTTATTSTATAGTAAASTTTPAAAATSSADIVTPGGVRLRPSGITNVQIPPAPPGPPPTGPKPPTNPTNPKPAANARAKTPPVIPALRPTNNLFKSRSEFLQNLPTLKSPKLRLLEHLIHCVFGPVRALTGNSVPSNLSDYQEWIDSRPPKPTKAMMSLKGDRAIKDIMFPKGDRGLKGAGLTETAQHLRRTGMIGLSLFRRGEDVLNFEMAGNQHVPKIEERRVRSVRENIG